MSDTQSQPELNQAALWGVLALVVACVIWGLSPLYYKMVSHLEPLEVLAHRTVWSLVVFGAVLIFQRRLAALPQLIQQAGGWVLLASLMISANWFLFIYAIGVGRTVETSIGYYIFPLVAVMIGAVVFGEKLTRLQWVTVAIVAAGVGTLTYGLGVVPIISLILATTFGIYGLLKKRMAAGPVLSVTAEVLVLAPLALGWLIWTYSIGTPPIASDWFILVLSGPLTAGPLILFSYASRRVRMATIGLVQYLNPTLQFLCAVVVFQEPFTSWHGIAFSMIWVALAIYSGQAFLIERRRQIQVPK